ncbi:glycine--tRNA ligase [bacterium]|nr:glycine--tRNA ligase [bacterium]
MRDNNLLTKIVSLCKRRGFVFPGSEIYGGLANTFDYGPLGVELLRNIKNHWWRTFVHQREDILGIDGGILLNRRVWEASGHTTGFIDVLVECKSCHKRFRADHLPKGINKCPECGGELTEPRKFNPMFKTFIGPVEEEAAVIYLRPETAQAIFVNFQNVVNTFRPKLPFGIAQIGKAFRNEITLGKFIFRTLEFEQMEIEYFIQEKEWEKYFEEWKQLMENWAVSLGVKREWLRWRAHTKDELAHYSKRTEDLEFEFEGEFKELYGLAYRTDFDLRNHSEHSGKDLRYQDPKTGEKFFPHVVEPSFGVNRTFLAILFSAYREEDKRVVLRLKPQIAPYKAAVFPLLANKKELVEKARRIYLSLKEEFNVAWDDRGNIGKRYFAQDEIGTPWCITVDFQTLKDNTVTIRDRDTTKQERIGVGKIKEYLKKRIS